MQKMIVNSLSQQLLKHNNRRKHNEDIFKMSILEAYGKSNTTSTADNIKPLKSPTRGIENAQIAH